MSEQRSSAELVDAVGHHAQLGHYGWREEAIALVEEWYRDVERGNRDLIGDLRYEVETLRTLAQGLAEALKAVKADRAYQKLSGGKYFTSAPTEQEWKRDSAKKAWALVEAALLQAKERGIT